MKYYKKNYNRLNRKGLYAIPSYNVFFKGNRRAMLMSKSGKVRRPSKRAMQWVEDLLAN